MIGILGLIIIGAVLLTLLISVIYLHIYQRGINKQLQTGTKGKKMAAPLTVCVVTFIFTLLAGFVLIAVLGSILYYVAPQTTSYQMENTDIHQLTSYSSNCYTADEISDSYAALYEGKAELPGYIRQEKTDGDFSYTYYISKEDYNILHPKCIVFLTYNGDGDYDLYEYYSGFSSDDCANYSGCDTEGSIPEYLCFLANADGSCTFDIGIAAYTQADYEVIQDTLANDETIDSMADAVSMAKISSRISIPLDYSGENPAENN